MTRRRPLLDVRGSTTVEFAIVGWMLCLVTFGIVETGLLFWLRSGMQLAAAAAARCGAEGYTYSNANNIANFLCTNTTTTQSYAVNYAIGNVAGNPSPPWLVANMITTANVTVHSPGPNSAYCNSAPGNFFAVSITSGFFQFLPPPLGNYVNLSTSACYPTP